jgi:hypothetical protein
MGSPRALMEGWKGGRLRVFRVGSVSLDDDPYGAVREKSGLSRSAERANDTSMLRRRNACRKKGIRKENPRCRIEVFAPGWMYS